MKIWRLVATTTLVLAGASVLLAQTLGDPAGQSIGSGSKANPGSLYSTGATNPYLDRVARKVGDVLMVEIKESSAATFSAATNTSKTDSNTASADVLKGFLGRIFGPLATSGSGAASGSGDTSHKSSMTTRMSVVIKEVLPDGHMVIEGTRTLVTNKETQTFVLTGLIRQADITTANIVDSTRIADASIKLAATGQVADRQRKGILTKLLDWLF